MSDGPTTVEEWLAIEGNEVTRERDTDETIHHVEVDGSRFRFQATSVPGQYRCLTTGVFAHTYHPLRGNRPRPYKCHSSCGAFGTIHAQGWYWCTEHAPEGYTS